MWLGVLPVAAYLRAANNVYVVAMLMRLQIPLPGLESGDVRCSNPKCQHGGLVDALGYHYGVCKRGAETGLSWSERHTQWLGYILLAFRSLGIGSIRDAQGSKWALDAGRGKSIFADGVFSSLFGPGRHFFFDISICDPRTKTAMEAPVSSVQQAGVAAGLRGAQKAAKYTEPAFRIGGSGFAGAIGERTGALGDGFVSLIKRFTGDGDRDSLLSHDYTFSASSRTTYLAQRIVFSLVMADAWMVVQNSTVDSRSTARPSSDAGARVALAAYIGHPQDGGARGNGSRSRRGATCGGGV